MTDNKQTDKLVVNNDGLPIHPWYRTVLISHFFFTMFLYFGWLSDNKITLIILLALLLICIPLMIINNGCIITHLEKKMSNGSDYTVIDPILEIAGMKPSRQNRTYITLLMFIISVSLTVIKLVYIIPRKKVTNNSQ